MYKPNKTHVVANALSKLPNIVEPTSLPNQTIDVSMFYTELECSNDVREYLKTWQIDGTLLVQHKWKLVKRVEPLALHNGELYKMG